ARPLSLAPAFGVGGGTEDLSHLLHRTLSQGGISGMEEAGLVEVLAPGAVQPVPAGG
ncbi:hypothetical protein JB92DRAFT_2990007, partial [Gautieria morchelliformis]